MMRRIEQSLVLREAAALQETPQRPQTSAMYVGLGIAILTAMVAAVMSFFSAKSSIPESTTIVADSTTRALYVQLEDHRLYPVTNLASARLIVGSPASPVAVKSQAIAKMPRGPLLGIPGAPVQMLPSSDPSSKWALCDTAAADSTVPLTKLTDDGESAGAPTTTAIGGALSTTTATSRALAGRQARLVAMDGRAWLIYREPAGTVVRAQVDTSNEPVMESLGLSSVTDVAGISAGLFNVLPVRPPLAAPSVPDSGSQSEAVAYQGDPATVGSVMVSSSVDGQRYFVVLRDGVQQISKTAAAVIRASDSQGAARPIEVTPDVVADVPRLHELDVDHFPADTVTLVDVRATPVTCMSWSKDGNDPTAHAEVLVGSALPVTDAQRSAAVQLVTGASSGGRTVDQVVMSYPSGRFVRVTGAEPKQITKESLWWISDTGVRYGIDIGGDQASNEKTVASLGIGNPVPAPWGIVKMFAIGPTLSTRDARIKHDGMLLDAHGEELPSTTPGGGDG